MSINNSQQISDIKLMLVKGNEGEGITSIEKTGTSGNVDTYTITYNDGSTSTFTVTNGTDASVIGYDNTTSGLVSTDVQDAIDEVNSKITDTSEANALNHLGFYLDENGGLCQVNSI